MTAPRSAYRAETERGLSVGSQDPAPRSVSAPIHTAGRYFACHDPEAQWIADQEAASSTCEAAL